MAYPPSTFMAPGISRSRLTVQVVCTPQVIKVVAPKRAALLVAEAAYEAVMVGLRAKQYELQVTCLPVYRDGAGRRVP